MSRQRLEGELALDGRGWEKTLTRAGEQVEHLAEHNLGHLKSAIAGAFTVGVVESMIHGAIEWGEEIRNTATRLGVSTTAAQEFDYAAKQTHTDLEQVATGLGRLGKALTAIEEGSKDAEKFEAAFKRLGITTEELKGKSAEQVFSLMGEKLEGLSVTAGVSTSMLDLFGKAGTKLIPMLKELNENVQHAHDLGLILDDSQIKTLDDAAKTMATLGTVSKVVGAGIIVDAKMITTGWWDYAKALVTVKERMDDVFGKATIAAMEKTLQAQQELKADLAEHNKRTEAQPTGGTVGEQEAMQKQMEHLREDTQRHRQRRADKADEGLPVVEQLDKVDAKIKDLEGELGRLNKLGLGSGFNATDITNQVEKLKDKQDELRDKRAREVNKEARTPGHAQSVKADSLVSVGNFLGESSRSIPAIQERMIDAHKTTTDALNGLTAVMRQWLTQHGVGGAGDNLGLP